MRRRGATTKEPYIITVEDLKITVVRKQIRNMYLRLQRRTGQFQLTAGPSFSETKIREFLRTKAAWMREVQHQWQTRYMREHLAEVELATSGVTSACLYIWGEPYRVVVETIEAAAPEESRVCIKPATSRTAGTYPTLVIRRRSDEPVLDLLYAWYHTQLAKELAQRLPECEKRVGTTCADWKIKKLTSKWGSCHIPSRVITLNLELVKKPPMCLYYVVIHELVHLYEPGHNARFYRFMDTFLPDWRTWKAALQQHT